MCTAGQLPWCDVSNADAAAAAAAINLNFNQELVHPGVQARTLIAALGTRSLVAAKCHQTKTAQSFKGATSRMFIVHTKMRSIIAQQGSCQVPARFLPGSKREYYCSARFSKVPARFLPGSKKRGILAQQASCQFPARQVHGCLPARLQPGSSQVPARFLHSRCTAACLPAAQRPARRVTRAQRHDHARGLSHDGAAAVAGGIVRPVRAVPFHLLRHPVLHSIMRCWR